MYRKVFTILLVFTALRSSNGLECGTCHEAEHISKCFTSVECDSQECFLHITDHGTHHSYTAGCGTIAGCAASDTRQPGVLSKLKRASQHMCSMCCTTKMCNVINPHCGTHLTTTPYATSAPDSTIKTTYATPPTDDATTTAKATTFAVPNPVTTVKTTYATSPSGHPQKGARCEVCSGKLCNVLPDADAIVECPVNTPFCLSTIVNIDSGARKITKSCVDRKTCDVKWLRESSDRVTCTDFNPLIIYNSNFTCSYCCVSDDCNRDIYPSQSTLYKGTS